MNKVAKAEKKELVDHVKHIILKGLSFMLFFSISTAVYSQHEALKFNNLFDASSNPDVACYRIPSIVTATNGDLIVAIDERIPSCGHLKWSRNINIVMRRSSDHGSSWTEIERIIDYPDGKSASDPSMIVDAEKGIIFLGFN